MKNIWGRSRIAHLLWTFTCAILGVVSAAAATLEWSPNPASDNIAFYTVYVESASGTVANEVHDGTRFDLDNLLPNVSYTIFVTATSAEGLESERSAGLPYLYTPVVAPSISVQPISTNLATGNAVSLAVGVSSATAVTYEWRKDGQVLAGQTAASLTIASASVADSGLYTVVVANSGGSVESNPATVVIQVPPSIQTQPQSAGVPVGTGMLLTVGANGTALWYQWFKGAQVIEGATNATYAIAAVSADDEGAYHASVSNLVGVATSDSAAITILYPPAVVTAPGSTNVPTGGTIQLAVSVSGTQPITFQWMKNGQPIANATSSSLVISSASVEDSGAYRLQVSNVVDSVTSVPAIVSVLDAPVIVAEPVSKDILEGSLLELTVGAQGSGVLSYQWLFNGAPLAGGSSSTLQISAATAANAGAYTVLVSNSIGSAQSTVATVRVLPRIAILQQPTSTSVQPGETIALTVQATGPDPLAYQWFHGGVPIADATGAALQIAQVSSVDAGEYSVRISSSLETVTSVSARVTILQSAPVITAHPQSVGVAQGGQLSLAVSATGLELSYQWLKNDAPIAGATSSILAISNFAASDVGSYSVTVTNPFGSVSSDTAAVSLIVPPVIVESPASTNLAVGGTIQLSVSATGTQPFTLAWFKDGVLVSGATNDLLVIPSATTNLSGTYQALIANDAGDALSAGAIVSVLEPVRIVTGPSGADLLEGTRLVLSVQATGSGVLSYQWFRNGAAITGANSATFEIPSVTTADGGGYAVGLSNLISGLTSAPVMVQIFAPITIVQAPSSTNLASGGELRLSVQATGPAGLTYQWYKNGGKLNGKTGFELVVASASSTDAGNYTVEISSAVQKVVSPTAQVSITTEPVATDCALTLSTASDGTLRISGVAPANTTYEIQRSDSLTLPRWRRVQTISTTADGRFQVTLSSTTSRTGFLRTVRR